MNKDFNKKILKIIGITAIILAIQFAAIFFLVRYLNKSITDINQKQRLLAIAKAERLSSVSLQNDFKKVENYLPVFEKIFPDEESLYYFISQMESLATRTGNRIAIQITSSKAAVDSATGSKYVLFSAAMNGNYDSLKRYLAELNQGRYFVSISSLSISGNPSVNNESTMNLSGKIYLK